MVGLSRNTDRRVRVALVGTGFVGRVHLEAILRLGFVDVCALGTATADLESAKRLASDFGIPTTRRSNRDTPSPSPDPR